jgi:hypothetical protein
VSSRSAVAVAAIGIAVVALIVVVLVMPGGQERTLRDAREVMEDVYASGDAAAVFERAVPESLPQDPQQVEGLANSLSSLLEQPFVVSEEEVIRVQGVDIGRIRVGAVNWCVTPDGGILLGCRVARASVEASTTLGGVHLANAVLDIFADRVDVAAVLEPEGDETVHLEGPPVFESDLATHARLADADYLRSEERLRVPIEAVVEEMNLEPGFGLLIVFETTGIDDINDVTDASFRYVWDRGVVVVRVKEILWLVG